MGLPVHFVIRAHMDHGPGPPGATHYSLSGRLSKVDPRLGSSPIKPIPLSPPPIRSLGKSVPFPSS
jgi:hypothetical protein